jgi:hypothetical protein
VAARAEKQVPHRASGPVRNDKIFGLVCNDKIFGLVCNGKILAWFAMTGFLSDVRFLIPRD